MLSITKCHLSFSMRLYTVKSIFGDSSGENLALGFFGNLTHPEGNQTLSHLLPAGAQSGCLPPAQTRLCSSSSSSLPCTDRGVGLLVAVTEVSLSPGILLGCCRAWLCDIIGDGCWRAQQPTTAAALHGMYLPLCRVRVQRHHQQQQRSSSTSSVCCACPTKSTCAAVFICVFVAAQPAGPHEKEENII